MFGQGMSVADHWNNIGRCYDEHGAAVYAYVRGMIGSTRAEAITRDVFVEFFRAETPVANRISDRTALLAMSDRFVTMALHGRKADVSRSSEFLESALASLTQADRRAVLFVAHGDSHSETSAQALQLSVQAMATRVQSGLRHLGLQLSEQS
jgi:DNA-directed RNA polymerase specialized sigma24 family protein